ncbi:hypothetical protein ACFVH6_23380 [Spirillospora sp. NPDC127200]
MPSNLMRAALYACADEPDLFAAEQELQRQAGIATGLALAQQGWITYRFYDRGPVRHIPWKDRPRASELLSQITGPECPFGALVLGSVRRTLPPDGYHQLLHQVIGHGLAVWLPQTEGPLDPASPIHQRLLAAALHLDHNPQAPGEGREEGRR